jgi:cell division GTPase FtsZ
MRITYSNVDYDEDISILAYGVNRLLNEIGVINLDVADFISILGRSGTALTGAGVADGISAAARSALDKLRADGDLSRCTGAIIGVIAGGDASLSELESAFQIVTEVLPDGANIVFGTNFEQTQNSEAKVIILAKLDD